MLAVLGEQFSVGPSIGEDQDHHIEPGVALLQLDFPFGRLSVHEARLRLEPDRALLERRSRIERPEVTRDRQRYLGLERDTLPKSSPKAAEEGKVCCVARRISRGVGAHRKDQANGGAGQLEVPNRDSLDMVLLDPPERRVGQAYGPSGGPQA